MLGLVLVILGWCFETRNTRRARSSSRGVFVCPPMSADDTAITAGATTGNAPEEGFSHGNRNSEVVQRREGLRLHHARGRRGRVRPLLRRPGARLQEPC